MHKVENGEESILRLNPPPLLRRLAEMSWSAPTVDLALALAFNLLFTMAGLTSLLIPQTIRPNPGELLPIGPNGTSVFVRDPQHCFPRMAESVPLWMLFVFVAATLACVVGISAGTSHENMHGLAPPTAWLWAVGFTRVLTDLLKNYVGR